MPLALSEAVNTTLVEFSALLDVWVGPPWGGGKFINRGDRRVAMVDLGTHRCYVIHENGSTGHVLHVGRFSDCVLYNWFGGRMVPKKGFRLAAAKRKAVRLMQDRLDRF